MKNPNARFQRFYATSQCLEGRNSHAAALVEALTGLEFEEVFKILNAAKCGSFSVDFLTSLPARYDIARNFKLGEFQMPGVGVLDPPNVAWLYLTKAYHFVEKTFCMIDNVYQNYHKIDWYRDSDGRIVRIKELFAYEEDSSDKLDVGHLQIFLRKFPEPDDATKLIVRDILKSIDPYFTFTSLYRGRAKPLQLAVICNEYYSSEKVVLDWLYFGPTPVWSRKNHRRFPYELRRQLEMMSLINNRYRLFNKDVLKYVLFSFLIAGYYEHLRDISRLDFLMEQERMFQYRKHCQEERRKR